ncbi:MAG: hypothetical protein KAH25_12570 [Bacteroidales bacterium]|nr:hypothetical protein [Bacteroidales bacterium]
MRKTGSEYQTKYRKSLKDKNLTKLSVVIPKEVKQAVDIFAIKQDENKGIVWNNIIEAGVKAYGISIEN